MSRITNIKDADPINKIVQDIREIVYGTKYKNLSVAAVVGVLDCVKFEVLRKSESDNE